MSNQRYFTVQCDKCEAQTPAGEDGMREKRAEAKAAGWKLGKSKDFCPSCSAEIAKAVASAKAGDV